MKILKKLRKELCLFFGYSFFKSTIHVPETEWYSVGDILKTLNNTSLRVERVVGWTSHIEVSKENWLGTLARKKGWI